MPFVISEYKIYGSLWGNYNELREVIELAAKRKLKHKLNRFSLSDINKAIDLLKNGNALRMPTVILTLGEPNFRDVTRNITLALSHPTSALNLTPTLTLPSVKLYVIWLST